MKKLHHAQQGVAIIMVLLIVAMATSITTYMAVQQAAWQRQVESQINRAQARRIGVAAIDWARAILADDGANSTTDHEKELWTKRLPAMPIDNGEIIGQIEDRQGLFNLNNLVRNGNASENDIAHFRRLLAALSLPENLADSLADWMDEDSEMRFPDGAEDVYYLAQSRPYRAANHMLSEVNELVLVKGFNKKIIERLQPFVTTLPLATPLNINFASAEVLSAVLPGLGLSDARVLVQKRNSAPFKDVEEFGKLLPKGLQVQADSLTVSSQFFWVTGRAKIGRAQVTTQALLQRMGGWPSVVWQSVI